MKQKEKIERIIVSIVNKVSRRLLNELIKFRSINHTAAPLHVAAYQILRRTVKALLRKKVNTAIKDDHGITALFYVCRRIGIYK